MATPKQTDPQFKLRLPLELKERIEKAAVTNNRSMNAEIVDRLEQSFDIEAAERNLREERAAIDAILKRMAEQSSTNNARWDAIERFLIGMARHAGLPGAADARSFGDLNLTPQDDIEDRVAAFNEMIEKR